MSVNLTPSPDLARSGGAAMPRGEEIASFATYAEAQHAVDALSDEGFPVQYLAIIGTDLRQVERITGRMSWGRAIASGAGSGLWIGIFFGVMMQLFNPSDSALPLVACVLMGVVWGILFQVASYALTRGRRDFTSISQVIASRYSIIAAQDAREAARALAHVPGNLTRGGEAARRAEERRRAREADRGPTAFGSRPDEQPRYGVRLPQGAGGRPVGDAMAGTAGEVTAVTGGEVTGEDDVEDTAENVTVQGAANGGTASGGGGGSDQPVHPGQYGTTGRD
ncbi:general stress protein [Actinomyces wuliandei]|uniref:general stress protein n=1 Tax=Actinomyces wuliandei TaxID=2057743 RepID=UPI001FA9AF49|nr:general stress protein [Actinomyces wuliandei]